MRHAFFIFIKISKWLQLKLQFREYLMLRVEYNITKMVADKWGQLLLCYWDASITINSFGVLKNFKNVDYEGIIDQQGRCLGHY